MSMQAPINPGVIGPGDSSCFDTYEDTELTELFESFDMNSAAHKEGSSASKDNFEAPYFHNGNILDGMTLNPSIYSFQFIVLSFAC